MLAGVRLVSPSPEAVPVATVLVPAPTPEATIKGHKLLDSLVTKFPLNTFSTPTPTPGETSAPSVPTLKELLLKVPHSVLNPTGPKYVNVHCMQSISLTAQALLLYSYTNPISACTMSDPQWGEE